MTSSSPLEFELRSIRIPYRFRYGHAAKLHRGLEAVVCVVRDDRGNTGLGEAVPRTYVTGETVETIFRDAVGLAARLDWSASNAVAMTDARVELARAWEGPFPCCALCLLDTAMIDLLSRRDDVSFSHWLGATSTAPVDYSGSIGISGKTKTAALAWLYRWLGFRNIKVKVGGDDDEQRLRFIRRRLGDDVRIFVDANASWGRETAIRKIEAFQRLNVWAVEEPLAIRPAEVNDDGRHDRPAVLDEAHFANYGWLRRRSSLPLIADESLLCPRSLERILQQEAFDVLNVRLSKCGGPLLAGRMIDRALAAGYQFALGAMVGETPILATAGAHFAAAHPERLYTQGYSHRILHGRRFAFGESPLRRAQVRFRSGIRGLGLQVDSRRLDRLTVDSRRITP